MAMPALNLLLPEIALLMCALAVVLLDLVVRDKRRLAIFSGAGLLLAVVLAVNAPASAPNDGTTYVLAIDGVTRVFRVLLAISTLLVVMAAADHITRRLRGAQGEFYALLLFACAAMMFLTSATELVTAYIALETTGIALYALSGFARDQRSAEAGIKFLVLGGVSSALLLYGMAMLFGLAGSTQYGQVAAAVVRSMGDNQLPIMLATVLMVAGFGLKMAAFPFHMWAPDVYEGAPMPVTMFLSVVSKAAGFGVALRFFHTALGAPMIALDWAYIFAALAALTMTVGNLGALRQRNIKRLLGYSSVAQAGYLMVGLAVTHPQLGTAAVTFFLLSYAATSLAAFAAIIALTDGLGTEEIGGLAGAAQRSPLLAFCLAVAMLSLTGIPPTAGFFAKLTVFGVAVQQGLLWLVLVGVINSVVSAYYYIGIVKAMYVGAPQGETAPLPLPAALAVGLGFATALTLVLGLWPEPALSSAITAAHWLP